MGHMVSDLGGGLVGGDRVHPQVPAQRERTTYRQAHYASLRWLEEEGEKNYVALREDKAKWNRDLRSCGCGQGCSEDAVGGGNRGPESKYVESLAALLQH